MENDPQLRQRGMYTEMKHPMLGNWKFKNAPFKLEKSPARVDKPPPMIGQHNREIFENLLGLTLEEISEAYDDGTFWPPQMPKYPYIQEALL